MAEDNATMRNCKRAREVSEQPLLSSILSVEDVDLVHACWLFLNAAQRVDSGRFPSKAQQDYSVLEAYLLLAQATNQAGLFRSMRVPFGDAGAEFIFPGASAMHDVPQDEWDAFAERTSEMLQKLAVEK